MPMIDPWRLGANVRRWASSSLIGGAAATGNSRATLPVVTMPAGRKVGALIGHSADTHDVSLRMRDDTGLRPQQRKLGLAQETASHGEEPCRSVASEIVRSVDVEAAVRDVRSLKPIQSAVAACLVTAMRV